MGNVLAENNIRLVYGGSNIELMRIIAKTVLENGGEVTGVMSKHLLDKEDEKFFNASYRHLIQIDSDLQSLIKKCRNISH